MHARASIAWQTVVIGASFPSDGLSSCAECAAPEIGAKIEQSQGCLTTTHGIIFHLAGGENDESDH